MAFKDALRHLRVTRGLTQADLAKDIGVTHQAISFYENGREPNCDTLIKIANYFNVSLAFLGGRDFAETQKEVALKGCTGEEEAILKNIVIAWDIFLSIERYHPCEEQEFAVAVHALQQLIGMRILNREHPEIFPKK